MRAAKQTSVERITRPRKSAADAVFLLENGARMDQPTFHKLYLQTPEGFRAELIGGTVYVMASPVSPRHGQPNARIACWLCVYSDSTIGTDVYDNTTHILGAGSEPQPDVALLLQPEYGGRAVVQKKAVVGPPELVVEVANSSISIDLGRKKADYEQAGVSEYLVVTVEDRALVWFQRAKSGFQELTPSADGVYRSRVFPGLWLDARAMFDPTLRRLMTVTRMGLASPEHAAFVAELAARKKAAAKKPRKSK